MKISISIATFLLAGAGVAGIGALAPIESPLQGSDTLFNVTQDALTALAAQGQNIGPASTYVGGGSGNGQSALMGGTQHVAPMSRMLNNGVCTINTSNASGVVIGLDGVDLFAAGEQGSNAATCNAPGTGFAFDGANGSGFANYKNVLALVYGGLDNATGTINCNSAKRIAVVNNWSSLFENSCSNSDASCNNAAHGGNLVCSAGGAACATFGAVCNTTGTCINSNPVKLWHAFRRDDASGTSDVFATILGIAPNTSASSLNGFGASPYCNSLNWDTATTNANCAAGAGKQFIGPGGVPQGFCSVTTTQACIIGAFFCDANSTPANVGLRCDPAPSPNTCGGTGLCVASNAPCPSGEVCQPLAGDSHRRPPLNTWGDDPDPNTNTRGENDADVLPTSFQDNDPIRRACVGAQVYTVARDAEEVCNREGTLGLVVPVPASDFIDNIPDPNHAGQNLVGFSMNPCNNFVLGAATKVLNCAPRNTAVHTGECPNGDLGFGASHTCEVSVDTANNTSQCQQAKTGTFGVRARPSPLTADNRVFNIHLHDGTTVDGSVGYVHETIPTATITLSLDFAAAFNRIHQVGTVPAAGAGHVGGCTLKDSTDQIACFTHADHCSIGYAGDGGNTYGQRYANGTCATGGAQCSTNGNPCSYFTGNSGACNVAAQFPAIASGPVLVNKVSPSFATVQQLGHGATEYPLSRKLYLNSLNFSQGLDDAGNPDSSAPFSAGVTASELTLAKFESTLGTTGTCGGSPLTCSVGGASCTTAGAPCIAASPTLDGINPILLKDGFFLLGPSAPNGANTPFCEDFNTALVCGDAGIPQDNACARNPAQWVPTDPSSVPDANTRSTVCGNGVLDAFEECDPALPPSAWTCSVPGATSCSSTCRC